MNAKKVKLTLDQVHHGRIAYVASWGYIERIVLLGKPFVFTFSAGHTGLFVKYRSNAGYESDRSLRDMGVITPYNYKRTFRKRKHAEAWLEHLKRDPGFKRHQEQHVRWCESMEGPRFDYAYDDELAYELHDYQQEALDAVLAKTTCSGVSVHGAGKHG